eukprot:TRINITY_DN26766_c0_g2_i1.p1 TRINITY_DN26766_c0_g2~~TRINITY_DN26766_c0_g2_i1.p1  ORF type:complete len:327 (-),score=61.39 TRINITY_DN26766_c0_g2_i1:385-1365(-)
MAAGVSHRSFSERQPQERNAYELRLTRCSSANQKLQVWCDYLRWVRDATPDQLQALTARACQELPPNVLRDDVRYLRLWIRNAMMHPDLSVPEALESLHSKGIGNTHALLYEAWAAALEHGRRFAEARVVYRLGLECAAQPIQRLRQGFKDFETRMQKRCAHRVARVSARNEASMAPAKASVPAHDVNLSGTVGKEEDPPSRKRRAPASPMAVCTVLRTVTPVPEVGEPEQKRPRVGFFGRLFGQRNNVAQEEAEPSNKNQPASATENLAAEETNGLLASGLEALGQELLDEASRDAVEAPSAKDIPKGAEEEPSRSRLHWLVPWW